MYILRLNICILQMITRTSSVGDYLSISLVPRISSKVFRSCAHVRGHFVALMG
jgi:hypothetical protein